MRNNPQSKDFRYVYSNGTQIQMGSGEATLIFGIKEDQSIPDEIMLEEVGVIMSPSSAKLLAYTLTTVISHMEKSMGTEISIDQSKVAAIDKAIKLADEVTQ